ncbi:MAG: SufD family Fe-S cluster assembly protein [Nanoarchaeota archaeon]|nr:SufD family Fe-S cluster assembly protein [Nanoarchaeota archaeon]
MNPDFFRLIGYYLAEGSTINEHYLCFDFNSKERDYIDDVKSLLVKVFKANPYEQPHKLNNGVSVRVNSTKLARLFKNFGDRNYNKKLPQWTVFEKKENQKELIKGWFRGDGNYYSRRHQSGFKEVFRINTTSEILTRQGRDILLRLGIVSFINQRDRSKEGRRKMFTLGISGYFLPKFGNLVGIKAKEKLHNKNRASMFGINEKFAFFPIKKITKKVVKNISTFNFSVEGDETYTVAGVAVHNCSAPEYTENSLHAGGVEIHVLKGARVRYSSIENWSKNTYNLNTKRAVVEENGIIEWVNGNLGCLTGDTKIFTNQKGPIEIKSIEKGDGVYVWNEKTNKIDESRVKNKMFSGNKKVYKLEAGGREIEASGNHPFLNLVRRKHKESHKKSFFYTEWKPLEKLKVGDIIGISKKINLKGNPYILPKIEKNYFVNSKNQYSQFKMNTSHLYNKKISIQKETNEDFMWLMGLIMGDGHVDLSQNKINIATHVTEDYREDLIKLLKKLFNYKVTEKKERYIVINSRVLCQLLNKIGFVGNAGTKKIPKWVFTLPENQIMSFVAGYSDSDGHVEGGGLYLTSVNKNLLEQVKLLGIQIGFGVSKVFVHGKAKEISILGKITKAKDSWRILFNGKKTKEIPLRCKKKKEKIIKIKTRRVDSSSEGLNFKSKTNEDIGFVRIRKIKEIGVKPTFDIEIENHNNFIANGLIVHNSKLTMLYPCSVLKGKNSKSDYIGIAYAGKGQYQDTGCKIYHLNENTSSTVLSKGISVDGGVSSYRGLVQINKGAINSKSSVRCDGLMLDNKSKAMTLPSMDVHENNVEVSHEAAVGKVGEEDLFYLMSRGLPESEAIKLIVAGFIEPVVKELPLEYAVELNKLIELEIENSVC